jgi:transposase
MNTQSNDCFTAFVGIDWADTKHDICVQAAGSVERQFDCIQHKVNHIEQWVLDLHQRFGGPIAIAVELSKGPIVYALQKYDFLVIFPIHALTLARYRQAFSPSGAKDDPTDAECALELLLHHPDQFKPLHPQSATMRALATLVEQRRRWVSDRVRLTNRLRYALKQYYPQALDWFPRGVATPLFCDFISRWPTLMQVKKARKNTLLTFFHDHRLYRTQVLEKRLQAIREASPLTLDDAVIYPYKLQTLALVDQLRLILQTIKRYDQEIEEVASQHEDIGLFQSLPGAGESLAPRLLVAFGEQRDRFANAAELQKYAGIAPVLERSGKKTWVHWRWQCSRFLRQTFVEWAAQTINKSYWAGAYYRQQREKGCKRQVALRALAFKWIRILYHCWQTNKPYDESVYLKALARRGSPLLNPIDAVGQQTA